MSLDANVQMPARPLLSGVPAFKAWAHAPKPRAARRMNRAVLAAGAGLAVAGWIAQQVTAANLLAPEGTLMALAALVILASGVAMLSGVAMSVAAFALGKRASIVLQFTAALATTKFALVAAAMALA